MNTTANLGLNLPESSDYADIAVLNANFQKLDAVIAAARSAEEYNPAGTYAVGAYCTHEGKLYKCKTAITAGEEWTAGHWTATSVGEELLAVIAALAGKADIASSVCYRTMTLEQLNSPQNYSYVTSAPAYAGFGPRTDYWSVEYHHYADAVYGIQVITAVTVTGDRWYRVFLNGTPGEWKQLATATPPTEYDLPLASGLSTYFGRSVYWKNQFGEVNFYLSIKKSEISDDILNNSILFTLPVGYRPSTLGNAIALCTQGRINGTGEPGFITIGSDGVAYLYNHSSTSCCRVSARGSFVASN